MSEVLDSKTLKALSSETRQEIIKYLSKRPYTASELSKITKKHVTTITEHLDTLEKSGLIQKKEDEHKWVYYSLSGKGEKLFKPQYYSWIVVLSLSLLMLMLGAQQFVQPYTLSAGRDFSSEKALSSPAEAASSAAQTIVAPAADYSVLIGTTFVLLAAAGFTFLIARWFKHHRMLR